MLLLSLSVKYIRCKHIFQVTPNTSSGGLNPDADVFQSKVKPGDGTWDFFEPDFSLDGKFLNI